MYAKNPYILFFFELYQLYLLSSGKLFDRIFSLASCTLCIKMLTIYELRRQSSACILCSFATIMRLYTLLEVRGIASIECAISTAEDVGEVGHYFSRVFGVWRSDTRTKLIIMRRNHAVIFSIPTICHAIDCEGYIHTFVYVAIFSAIHMTEATRRNQTARLIE